MSEKINTQDLVRLLADKHKLSKEHADLFVKEFFQLIQEALTESKYVKVKGLGTFKLIEVESRESVNVNTGQRFEIQGHTKVSFTPDPSLRDQINRPFAHFETVPLQNEDLLETTPVEDEEAGDTEEKMMEEVDSVVEKVPSTVVPEKEETVVDKKEDVTLESVQVEDSSVEIEEEKSTLEQDMAQKTEPESLSPEEAKERAKTMKYFIGIVVFIILLCVAVLVLLYVPSITRAIYGIKAPTEQPAASEEPQYPIVRTDTISKDTVVTAAEPNPAASTPDPVVSASSVTVAPAFQPDSSGYEIVGTQESHTVKEGETLTRISLHYWGTKALWPYLVKHNPTVIKNPDNVPFGTTIQIPKLKKK